MATVNDISDLPGIAQPDVDPCEPSSEFLTRYFGNYERELGLHIVRPVRVSAVRREDDDPHGRLLIESSRATWAARGLINATGTWTKPFWPIYPGQAGFRGRQLHVADYVSAEEFRGQHVIVVGGGISAVRAARRDLPGDDHGLVHPPRTGLARGRVHAAGRSRRGRARRGEGAPGSAAAERRLRHRPRLDARAACRRRAGRPSATADVRRHRTRWGPPGRRRLPPAGVILWATGFRAALDHFAPLHLRAHGGGIVMDGTQVAAEPRVHLVGYGPSSSTIGANRAGRAAVASLVKWLEADAAARPSTPRA